MKNARMARARILKWVASGVMLALLFAIVFAGTLSGAFGIENTLQNSGVIENNVADAGYSSDISISATGKYFYNEDTISKEWDGLVDGTVTTNTAEATSTSWKYYKYDTTWIGSETTSKTDGTLSYSTQETKYTMSDSNNRSLVAAFDYTFTNTASIAKYVGIKYTISVSSSTGGAANTVMGIAAYEGKSGANGDISTFTTKNSKGDDDDSEHWGGTVSGATTIVEKNGKVQSESVTSMACAKIDSSDTYHITFVFGRNRSGDRNKDLVFTLSIDSIDVLGGEGANDSPLLLQDRTDFDIVSAITNSGTNFSDTYLKVQPDSKIDGQSDGDIINMETSSDNFTPIGNASNPFKGIVDGNNCRVENLKVEVDRYAGLFGYIENAKIYDLSVSGYAFAESKIVGVGAAGLLVGWMQSGRIYGTTKAILVAKENGDAVYGVCAGGLVGENIGGEISGTIEVSGDEVDKETGGVFMMGGVVGYNAGTINATITCSVRVIVRTGGKIANVTPEGAGENGAYAGGIVGYNAGTLSGTFNRIDARDKNDKTISGDTIAPNGHNYVGGIVGYNTGTMSGTFNHTSQHYDPNVKVGATVYGGQYIGGIVGHTTNGTISGSKNTSSVIGGTYVGGICGFMDTGVTVEHSYSTGNVTATTAVVNPEVDWWSSGADNPGGGYVGGIAGWSKGSIKFCYTEGTLKTKTGFLGGITSAQYVGGSNTLQYCYTMATYDTQNDNERSAGYVVGHMYTVSNGASGSAYMDTSTCWAFFGSIPGVDNNIGQVNDGETYANATDKKYTRGLAAYVLAENDTKLKELVKPAIISDDGSVVETNIAWTDIINKNITGFSLRWDNLGSGQRVAGYEMAKTSWREEASILADTVEPKKTESFISADKTKLSVSLTFSASYGEVEMSGSVPKIGFTIGVEENTANVLGGTEAVYGTPIKITTTDKVNIRELPSNASSTYDHGANLVATNGGTISPVVGKHSYLVEYLTGDGNADSVLGYNIITYTVTKKELTIETTWTNESHNFTYSGKQQGLSKFTINGLEYDDKIGDTGNNKKLTVTLNPDTYYSQSGDLKNVYTLKDNVSVNADNYNITITIDAHNYTLKDSSGNNMSFVTYSWTIGKKDLDITLHWSDGATGATHDNFIYNGTQQGLDGITFSGFAPGENLGTIQNDITVEPNANYKINVNGNKYDWANTTCYKNADNYTVQITITATNYKIKGNSTGTVSYSWRIDPLSLNNSNVYFGADTTMLVGNTHDIAQTIGLNIRELQNALVYTGSGYSKDNVVIFVKLKDKTVKLNYQDTGFTLTGWVDNPGDLDTVTLTATGTGNYTGSISKTFTAMKSDFGGSYTGSNWGSSAYPFEISHPAHLIRLSEIVNGGKAWNSIRTTNTNLCATNNASVASDITARTYQNAYFKVTSDTIDVKKFLDSKSFTPIGKISGTYSASTSESNMYPFSGIFDGNGKTITLNVNTTSDFAGLFGFVKGGHREKVDDKTTITVSYGTTIKNVVISGSVAGGNYVGGLVGHIILAQIENCTNLATIKGASYVGGLVGMSGNYLTNQASYGFSASGLVNEGKVDASGSNVGGIVGYTRDVIYSGAISNSGEIKGGSYTGGIFGVLCGGSLGVSQNGAPSTDTATNSNNVSGGDFTGGIIGRVTWATVYGTLNNSGTVSGTNGVGGIVGGFNCYLDGGTMKTDLNSDFKTNSATNTGAVSGTSYVGGIFGSCFTKGDANRFYTGTLKNTNSVTATGTYVGGIAGWLEASNSTNSVTITTDTNTNANATIKIDTSTAITVTGKNCVGYLFGALVGNGYHETASSSMGTELKIANTFSGNVNGVDGGAVLGGLVGFMSKSAMMFSTNWNTSNITFGSLTNVSFVGGLIGMLGENGTIESVVQYGADGTPKSGTIYTITANNTGLGAATINNGVVTVTSRLGSFVGGIVGYVTSSAGSYYGDDSTILGNTVKFKSNASIYATGYVGGIFGAVGDFDPDTADSLAEQCGNDIKSYLGNLLKTGNFAAQKGQKTVTINPNGTEQWHTSGGGQFVNNGGGYILASKDYAGGIIGFVGGFATINFENDKDKMLDGNNAINENLSVYVDTKYVHIGANSYAGGLIGYLSNGAHSLKYIVSGAYMGVNTQAQYVGGIVGYMISGTVEGCVAIYPDSQLWHYSSTYKGAQNVGGIVGFTINGVITNCVSAGFNLEETTSTKGGILGGGVNPTITSSWAFYIASVGSTYTRVSNNAYGKYIAVDDDVDMQPTIQNLVGFVNGDSFTLGDKTITFTVNSIAFAVKIPSDNKQLAFYNGTGTDTVTGNKGDSDTSKFTTFSQQNGILTIGLNKATAESMQVYVVDIEFVDIPQGTTGDTDKVQKTYRHPSNSENYEAEVFTAVFSNNYITEISANIYFNPTGTGQTLVGALTDENKGINGVNNSNYIGNYKNNKLDPPFTISSLMEWNDFAQSVQDGKNDNYSGKTVKLLADIPLKDENGKVLSSEPTTITLAGVLGSGFKGTFDGNDHTIDIGTITATADGTSLFPYANGATFKNLTIAGTINSTGNGTAAFVGIAGGSLTFENCTSDVTMYTNKADIGGILGQSAVTTTTPTNDVYVLNYTFIDCVNTGNIQNYYTTYKTGGTGGIVGNILTSDGAYIQYGTTSTSSDSGNATIKVTLESCRNAGKIDGTFNVGGIIGRNGGDTTITNCGNTGAITAYGSSYTYDTTKLEFTGGTQVNGQDTSVGGIGGLVTQKGKTGVYASYNSGKIVGWGNKAGGILASDAEYATSSATTKIYYCYNTGDVMTGGDETKLANEQPGTDSASWGCNCGGILGTMVNADMQYCYNTGDITTYGSYYGSWLTFSNRRKARVGGLVGFIDSSSKKTIKYCYNIGDVWVGFQTSGNETGAAAIVGGSKDDSASNSLSPNFANNYSLQNLVHQYNKSGQVETAGESNNYNYTGDGGTFHNGTLLSSIDKMTAYTGGGGNLRMASGGFAIDQNLSVLNDANGITQANGGYIYVHGCLPQLAVFAIDTKNGLAMTSVAYGKDQYGTYSLQQAGSESNPFIIKDGIDLLGLQALVNGYKVGDDYITYDTTGKYIEFANSTNNLNKTETKEIVFPDVNRDDDNNVLNTKHAGNGYKSKNGTSYTEGKSYHLFKLGAVCSSDSTYEAWLYQNNYYDVTQITTKNNEESGTYIDKNYASHYGNQNFNSIGKTTGTPFSGNISGKQSDGSCTKIVNARINREYCGLFDVVSNGTISYIELVDSTIKSVRVAGGIVARPRGTTVIDNCKISGTTTVKTYGSKDTYVCAVGGIAGYGYTYDDSKDNNGNVKGFVQGTVLTISNCTVDCTVNLEKGEGLIVGYVKYVGGIIGTVLDADSAYDKNNKVLIENCKVLGGNIQAKQSTTANDIGGIIGYSSYNANSDNLNIIIGIVGCEVGTGSGNVTISGKTNISGIAGAMSSVAGGYIENCTVGAEAIIKATADGATSIGGLVGSSDASPTEDGITMNFSRKNTFGGNIDLDGKNASNVGGIIGMMNRGASFNANSDVTVTGTIINPGASSTDFGGVAGLTAKVAFSGKYTVGPTMDTAVVDNVGGFIGRNTGETHILSEGTEITISGTIVGKKEVGGFIGVNDTDAKLVIGADMYSGVPRMGELTITIGAAISAPTNSDDNGVGDNVGGIVGKNDNNATVNIVKGTISTVGDRVVDGNTIKGSSVEGRNNVGGIVGLNDGDLNTGGSISTTIPLSITNAGSVTGKYFVGGVFGRLNKGTIAGVFTNDGRVTADSYAGGAIGFVAQGVTITSIGSATTEFVNTGVVIAEKYFAGGSIGILYGSISGASGTNPVLFTVRNKENAGNDDKATVSGLGYVGGSIGVIAGKVNYAKFVNSADLEVSNAQIAVGGSVGFVGLPLKEYVTNRDAIFTDNLDNNYDKVVGYNSSNEEAYYIYISNTQFEATGSLTIGTTSGVADNASTDSGGVGGAIGVVGGSTNKFSNGQWKDNTYYAMANVVAPGVNNVGGVFGLIRAEGFVISNMLAYQTTVQGGYNVGGIVGAVDAGNVTISQCFALEGEFSGTGNVGGIVGLAQGDTNANSSYWMLGLRNDILAESDITQLSTKLGFTLKTDGTFKEFSLLTADSDPHIYTTGDSKHGWYFIYANNANGDGGIGTINVTHKAGSTNGVSNSLAYWKFIAHAYSSGEDVPESMNGSALTSDGNIAQGHVYATATAATPQTDKDKTGYYLYTETSEKDTNPNIYQKDNTFYINIQTSNGVGNFVVYYREIKPVGALTYNGYERTAAIGMSDVGVIDKDASGAGDGYPILPSNKKYPDYKNSYRYTTVTTEKITDENGIVTEKDISSTMANHGVYNSKFYIYYFDGDGNPYLVGGHAALGWEIAKRKLEIDLTNHRENNNPIYGEETTGADMTLVVKNIAPAKGSTEPVTVKIIGKDNKTYEFSYVKTGDAEKYSTVACSSGQNVGVSVKAMWVYEGVLNNDNGKNDLEYIVGGIDGKDLNTITYTFEVYLKQAMNYTVKIGTTNNYTFDDSQLDLTVQQRALEITPYWSDETSGSSEKSFEYNTSIQGLVGISVNNVNTSQKTGLISGDTVMVIVKFYKDNATSSFDSIEIQISKSGVSLGKEVLEKISTIDAGTYKVKYAVKQDETGINYKIASATDEHYWTITPHVISLTDATISFKDANKTYGNEGSKTYDALAVTPVLSISNLTNNSGTEFKYGNDTIILKYKTNANDDVMVNAKATAYEIKVTDGNLSAKRNGNDVPSTNYSLEGSIVGKFTINPAKVMIDWNSGSFVYNNKTYGLTVQKVSIDGTTASPTTNTKDELIFKGYGNDTVTLTWSGQGENAGDYTMSLKSTGVNGTNADVDSIPYNYAVSLNDGKFTIKKSQLYISSATGSATKEYDATKEVKGYTISSATLESVGNKGHVPSSNWSNYFKVKSLSYNFTDVGTGTVNVTFTWNAGIIPNYESGGDRTVTISGKITPAHIKVVLDKLRNGKATRVFSKGSSTYGGTGAKGNVSSQVYRAGEGFTVSGVVNNEDVLIYAVFAEAGKDRSAFDSYVNGVYKDGDNYARDANAYFKKLVFTMSNDAAKNYTFNVYDTDGKAYSSSSGTSENPTVTVYDSDDTDTSHKNANSSSIRIEITVLTERVNYTNTYQSYVTDDGNYNDDLQEVGGTLKDGTALKVANGWLYNSDGNKKVYTGYTVITGKQGSTLLSAEIDSSNGMNFNYRLSNQPTLTIAYFVSETDAFKIDSMADLLIASFYYSASQNATAPEFVQIIQSGYKWHSVVTNENYLAGTKPSDTRYATWDEYFAYLETQGYYVFLNETEDSKDGMTANTWGYFEATSEGSTKIPASFLLTKDLNGALTETDIETLKAFFTVAKTDEDGNVTTKSYEWGYNKDYLTNVLTTKDGSVVTVLGSLFVTDSGNGFSGSFDGNGYVIEYLNIMGYGYDNVGLFDVIDTGTVKDLHLRNVSINANKGNVGGIAGEINAGDAVSNVSFHGSINVNGSATVGGLFGKSERAISNAIVLGTINSSNSSAVVGGVVGSSSASISNVVSMMQITTNGANTGAFVGSGTNATESYHMANAIYNGTAFINDSNAVSYSDLMAGSKTGYGVNKYYYEQNTTAPVKGTYDVLADVEYIKKDSADNARQSMRLYDIVSVYLLMYSLDDGNTTIDNSIKVYTISTSSWLVGDKHGTDATNDAIVIANKQNVSLLRELRFATFTLATSIDIEISSTFSGTFYGTVNAGSYKISCNKPMFAVYCNNESGWLTVEQN